ncbi:hypothetical protein N9185_00245 [bacterium]|nr:hypothetical protein [Planctomycetota bacterium]MDB4561784.1 hypothetical protein [bacterium]
MHVLQAAALLAALLAPAGASPQILAPPRGTLGPGTGASTDGGPGDRSPSAGAFSQPWRRWWDFNQDPYLARMRAPDVLPVRSRPLDRGRAAPNPRRPAMETTYGEVYPALLATLESTRDVDLQASCLLALAKIGEPPEAISKSLELPSLEGVLIPFLRAANERVRDLAVVALGISADASFAPLLASMARDRSVGRDAIRGGKIDRRTRSFATHALGLLGASTPRRAERALIEHELRRIAVENHDTADLLVAAVIALGWTPLPVQVQAEGEPPIPGSREATIRALLALDSRRGVDFRGRAQIPVAVARLLAAPLEATPDDAQLAASARLFELREEMVARFTARLHGPRAEKLATTREGLAQALGLLILDHATSADGEAIDALTAVATDGQETEALLSMIALARVCGRASLERGQTARDIRRTLTKLAMDGSSLRQASALLALGVADDRGQSTGQDPALGTRSFLARRAAEGSPARRTAAAIALGLTGDQERAEAVRSGLLSGGFQDRGARALAVAMLLDVPGLNTIRAELRSPLYRPYLTRDFATALALAGDPLLVPLLIDRLVNASFIPERVAAVQAFEWSSDPEAATAMLFVLTAPRLGSKRIDDTSRAFAASALGNLCSQDPLPWNARLALDVVWNAAPPSLTDARNGGGVLDVL